MDRARAPRYLTIMVDERAPLDNGTRLDRGRFEVVRLLGAGGFGLTYAAMDHPNAEMVALKEYFPARGATRTGVAVELEDPSRGSGIAAAYSEALFAGRVEHPSVAKTIRTFAENGTGYIAMEWIDGKTLLGFAERRALSNAELLKIYLTVLDAALHFSDAQLAHRDLNPNNIMIRDNGEPVIIDFGLARAVGPGYTLLTRTAAFVEGLEPPEQRVRAGKQGVWSDIYTLSASLYYVITRSLFNDSRRRLRDLYLARDTRVAGYDRALLDCIDAGLVTDIEQRLTSGPKALQMLGIGETDLQKILSPEVFARTLLLRDRITTPPSSAPEVSSRIRVSRYQRCLLQSFDTARFQGGSDGADRAQLQVDDARVASARTEAALNILFGRELVVPAGQIADGPTFRALFSELMPAYLDRRERIVAACKNEGLPVYQPMRLALEKPEMKDYCGFVEAYRYTGANLVLLADPGDLTDRQRKQAERVAGFQRLFLAGDFQALEKATDRPGYGEFAKSVKEYFGPAVALFADEQVPDVSSSDYRKVFERRLRDERVQGAGVAQARASLSLVEEIEVKLLERGVSGFRGNWYLFERDFGNVWPLARAYLDFRLFLGLARQYHVDHPVLLSQEFEYGVFDHSLVLGPKFAASISEDSTDSLPELRSSVAACIDWQALFELYCSDRFVRSISRMNQYYLNGNLEHYVDEVMSHGDLLNRLLPSTFRFQSHNGRLSVTAPNADANAKAVRSEGFEAAALTESRRGLDREIGADLSEAYDAAHEHASVAVLSNDANETGTQAARAVIHYLAKPYRLAAQELLAGKTVANAGAA